MAVPVVAKSGQVIGGLLYGHSKKDHFTSEHKLIVPISQVRHRLSRKL